jgi:hypothetical protein
MHKRVLTSDKRVKVASSSVRALSRETAIILTELSGPVNTDLDERLKGYNPARVMEIRADRRFLHAATRCLKENFPLIHVLRLSGSAAWCQ